MVNEDVYLVIMAGGIGSRLWPLSRAQKPKQFHDFLGLGKSLLQITYERHLALCKPENVLVVTHKNYHDLVKEQLPDLGDHQILLEPEGKNTAPCVAYATYKIASQHPNAVCVVCPADHLITQEDNYIDNVKTAVSHAATHDALITLGIRPTRPDTGYGYIRYHAEANGLVLPVKNFTEKPNKATAQSFLESGEYVWNAGIFIWSVRSISQAISACLPQQQQLFGNGTIPYFTSGEQAKVNEAYTQSESISIDYGIMEKAENVYTVLSTFNWSDLGTWGSVYAESTQNEEGNVTQGEVMTYGVHNCLLRTTSGKLMVVQGLTDYMVVDQEDVLMICARDEEQLVKQFVADVTGQQGGRFV